MFLNLINNLPDYFIDALKDSIEILPALFLIFVVIEIFETFFVHHLTKLISFSKKFGIIIGTCLAIIPQCGFSIIMTTLFLKKYITIGTLLAVYIATSDEAIPILLANPQQNITVLKIIMIKFVWAICVGYLIDLIFKTDLNTQKFEVMNEAEGCCKHNILEQNWKNIIVHPVKHTFFIFCFIFLILLIIQYSLNYQHFLPVIQNTKVLQPLIMSIIGLIPNCATSVFITMLYLKNIITFGSVIAGLTSNAGLGLIVLFSDKKNIKQAILIVLLLLLASLMIGICMNFYGKS